MKENRPDNSREFVALFRAHKDRIYNFCLKMLQNNDSAADITQEAFLKMLKYQNNGNGIDKPANWLFTTARNLCLNKLRDRKQTLELESMIEMPYGETDDLNIRLATLRRAFALLEPNCKEALILKEYEGFSYKEIAEITGLTESAVKSLLFRARHSLRELVDEQNRKR